MIRSTLIAAVMFLEIRYGFIVIYIIRLGFCPTFIQLSYGTVEIIKKYWKLSLELRVDVVAQTQPCVYDSFHESGH